MPMPPSTRDLAWIQKYIILVLASCLLYTHYRFIRSPSLLSLLENHTDHSSSFNTITQFDTSLVRTLIVYVYAKTHALSEQNLAFFVRTAVRQSHSADYYFVLQQIDNKHIDETTLPSLPSNAHYIQHENKCFDIGTIGWFLSNGTVDIRTYKYFIFLNSSVRGPFIVSYYDSLIWYTVFLRRLNQTTKLVGCTINCETSPHVQSYLWALDRQGLDLLLKNRTVFACYADKTDTINKAEIGASQIILQSGFGIDCLMRKHHGVDFRLTQNHKCNDVKIPTFNKGVDGISLDPFEVVFVKVKDRMPHYQDNRERVQAYEKWIH